jgi:hypothetical protein
MCGVLAASMCIAIKGRVSTFPHFPRWFVVDTVASFPSFVLLFSLLVV